MFRRTLYTAFVVVCIFRTAFLGRWMTAHDLGGSSVRDLLAASEYNASNLLLPIHSNEEDIAVPSSPVPESSASEDDFASQSRLFCIVTGCEHSGTTIISRFIMSSPNLIGGHETGLLLSDTPQQFRHVHPFYEWMLSPNNFWRLNQHSRSQMMQSETLAEMYQHLRASSPLFQQPENQDALMVDKTPTYIYNLDIIMDRSPGIPVVVVQKTREKLFASWNKRLPGTSLATFERRFQRAARALERARIKYPHRIHVVNMTHLYQDTHDEMKRLFDFLGLQWNDTYTTLAAYNDKIFGGNNNPKQQQQQQQQRPLIPGFDVHHNSALGQTPKW